MCLSQAINALNLLMKFWNHCDCLQEKKIVSITKYTQKLQFSIIGVNCNH
jgi:hypothetical protein